MNTYRVGALAAKVGGHRNTVKEWDRTGCFPARRTPGGQRFHTDEAVDRDCGRAPRSAPQRVAIPGRVSRRAPRPEREARRQAMETFRPGAGIAVDDGLDAIGGGLHFQRPVFRAGRERIARRERPLLRVAHKDRPCRCGFDGCEDCAETRDGAIRVVHRESLSPPAERVEDLMSVVHTFSSRPSGLRRYKKKIREDAPRWLRRSRASCTARG